MTDERRTDEDQYDEKGAGAGVEAGTEAQEREPEIGPGTRPGDDSDDGTTATPSGRP